MPTELRRIGILGRLDELDLAVAVLGELVGLEARTHERVGEQLDHQRAVARQELAADGDRFGARARR